MAYRRLYTWKVGRRRGGGGEEEETAHLSEDFQQKEPSTPSSMIGLRHMPYLHLLPWLVLGITYRVLFAQDIANQAPGTTQGWEQGIYKREVKMGQGQPYQGWSALMSWEHLLLPTAFQNKSCLLGLCWCVTKFFTMMRQEPRKNWPDTSFN